MKKKFAIHVNLTVMGMEPVSLLKILSEVMKILEVEKFLRDLDFSSTCSFIVLVFYI